MSPPSEIPSLSFMQDGLHLLPLGFRWFTLQYPQAEVIMVCVVNTVLQKTVLFRKVESHEVLALPSMLEPARFISRICENMAAQIWQDLSPMFKGWDANGAPVDP